VRGLARLRQPRARPGGCVCKVAPSGSAVVIHDVSEEPGQLLRRRVTRRYEWAGLPSWGGVDSDPCAGARKAFDSGKS